MTSPALERVYFGKYPYNLISSGNLQKYYQLLCNFEFLLGKIQHPEFGVQALIEDYDLLDDSDAKKHPDRNSEAVKALRLIQGALQLSEQVLIVEPTQLASQLWGRLHSFDIPEIQSLLQQTQQNPTIWLRPLKSSLIPAGGRLLRILRGHNDSVNAIAITQDGKQVVSGSEDGVLKVWELETGKKPLTLTGHSKLVTAIAISPDNKRVISGSEDGTLRVWDLTNGKELFALAESGYIAMGLAITSDSNWVISIGRIENKESWNRSIWHNCITLWDLKRTKHVFSEEIRLEGNQLAEPVALSSDGTKATFCSYRHGKYKYWDFIIKDLSDWHKILNVPNLEAKLNPNNYIAWVKTKLLEQLNQKNIISIGSRASMTIRKIMTVTVSPDGRQAITALADSTLIVWDLETKKQKFRLRGHSDTITAVAITSDGTQAVSSSKDKILKIWDLKTGEEISSFSDFNYFVNSIALTPNGKQIISGAKDGTIKFWKLNHNNHTNHNNSQISQKPLNIYKVYERELNNHQLFYNEPFSFGEAILFIIMYIIWVIFGLWIYMVLLSKPIEFLFSLFPFILNIGSLLVLPMWFRYVFLLDSQADMINIHQYHDNNFHGIKKLLYEMKYEKNLLNKHNDRITTITVNLSGDKVISGSKDKTMIIWDLTTLKQLYILTGHLNQVSSIAAIPNSKCIISSSFDGNLKIWDIENYNKVINLKFWSKTVYNIFYLIVKICLYIPYLTKSLLLWISFFESKISYFDLCGSLFLVELLAILAVLLIWFIDDKINGTPISRLIITSDGKKAVYASSNKKIKVWNLIEKKQIFVLRGHREWVTSIALISDDYLISGSKDKTLKVWNLGTRKELFTLTGHSSSVTAVAVTPDGLRAISGSSDGSLKVWDLKFRKAILTIDGHRDSVEAIAVTPDGKHLVSAASDHTLRVWNLFTGEEITRFTADTPLTCCTIAPEGTTIVAGDRVGQLHFLRLEGIGASP